MAVAYGRSEALAVREEARSRRLTGTTAGRAGGYVQANLVVLRAEAALEFVAFAQRNPRPCPLLEVLEPGDPEPRLSAPGADVRTDLPAYRVYRDGELESETADIGESWTDDAVAFLIGCSFTFEEALVAAGVPVRHLELGCTVPMYRTAIPTVPAGRFHGPLVVTMRPVPAALVPRAAQVTARFPRAHGAPLHVGAPEELGIESLERPDWGDPVPVRDGELPVFWACGVTPQSAALASRPDWMVTHSPGRMFVTDLPNRELDTAAGGSLA